MIQRYKACLQLGTGLQGHPSPRAPCGSEGSLLVLLNPCLIHILGGIFLGAPLKHHLTLETVLRKLTVKHLFINLYFRSVVLQKTA